MGAPRSSGEQVHAWSDAARRARARWRRVASAVPRGVAAVTAAALTIVVAARSASAQFPGAAQGARDEAKAAAARDEAKAERDRTHQLPPPPMFDANDMRLAGVPHPRSPVVAFALSAGATGAGELGALALVATMDPREDITPDMKTILLVPLVVGPSVGHLYTLDARTLFWLGLRAAGAAMVIHGAGEVCPPAIDDDECQSTERSGWQGAGLALVAAGIIGDLVTAPGSANRFNHHRSHEVHLSPMGVTGGGGLAAVGHW